MHLYESEVAKWTSAVVPSQCSGVQTGCNSNLSQLNSIWRRWIQCWLWTSHKSNAIESQALRACGTAVNKMFENLRIYLCNSVYLHTYHIMKYNDILHCHGQVAPGRAHLRVSLDTKSIWWWIMSLLLVAISGAYFFEKPLQKCKNRTHKNNSSPQKSKLLHFLVCFTKPWWDSGQRWQRTPTFRTSCCAKYSRNRRIQKTSKPNQSRSWRATRHNKTCSLDLGQKVHGRIFQRTNL